MDASAPGIALLGREDDIERVTRRLAPGRVTTVTAPGGMGKTTLAWAVSTAARVRGTPTWWADAAALEASEELGPLVASVLELGANADVDGAVADYLRGRSGLLVLDNLERVRDAAGWVAGLLAAAPTVTILGTSRRPLGIRGEHEVHLSGLALPASGALAHVEASPAGALFLTRARELRDLDPLAEPDAAAIAEIVRRLDGMPLAIELAAGRSRLFAPPALLENLDRPGTLRASDRRVGGRDRHASLANVLDWSLAMLAPEERALLDVIAVLPSTFDLALAEAVTEQDDAVGALDSLIAVGLVAAAGAERYRLLETIRAHVAGDVASEIRARALEHHARFYASLASAHEESMWAGSEATWQRLHVDHDNLIAAAEWAIGHDGPLGLRIMAAIENYWIDCPDPARARRTVLALLDATAEAGEDRDITVALAIWLTERLEGGPAALELAPEARRVAEHSSSARARRTVLMALSQTFFSVGDWAETERWSVAAAEASSDPEARRYLALTGRAIAMAATGRIEDALAMVRDAHRLALQAGHERNASTHLGAISQLELRLGHPARAIAAIDEAASLAGYELVTLETRAIAHAEAGLVDEAWRSLRGAWIQLEREARSQLDMLEALVCVLVASGRDEDAARGLALADALRPGSGWARHFVMAWLLERHRNGLRKRLGPVAAALSGASIPTTTRPADFIRSMLGAPASTARSGRRIQRGPDELTAREVEVLQLLASGLGDPQIAEALFISPKTASVHIANAKAKLGAGSRVELALRAREMWTEATDSGER
jgi:predicted ATPase/DNA-binding CsgD family transcriptional regulator